MPLQILADDLRSDPIIRFLQEHVEEMKSVTPVGSKHALDLEGLRKDNVTFWTAWLDGEVAGCAALKQLGPRHGEIKSMRTSKAHRGMGIATALLQHIFDEAVLRKYKLLSLETGSFEFFKPARALYQKHGFKCGEVFADYQPDPNSSFMHKQL